MSEKAEWIQTYVGEEPPNSLMFWCPGCGTHHHARVRELGEGSYKDKVKYPGPLWQWNGKTDESFTINPSLLVRSYHGDKVVATCHTFVKNGNIQYLNDCTHRLAGKIIPVPDAGACPGIENYL